MARLEDNFGIPNIGSEEASVAGVVEGANIETVLSERDRLDVVINEASRVAHLALKNKEIGSTEYDLIMDFLDREALEVNEIIYSEEQESEILKKLDEISERVDASARSESQSGLDKLKELLARDESRREDLEMMRSDERIMGAKGRGGRRVGL